MKSIDAHNNVQKFGTSHISDSLRFKRIQIRSVQLTMRLNSADFANVSDYSNDEIQKLK
jgi:hypothetical protein